jgi:hypothetical protein
MSNRGFSLGKALAGLFLSLVLALNVVLLIGLWLGVRSANIVFRAFATHPKSKALWRAAGISLLLIFVNFLPTDQTLAIMLFLGLVLSFIALVVTARRVERTGSTPGEHSSGLFSKVLFEPWWSSPKREQEKENDTDTAA